MLNMDIDRRNRQILKDMFLLGTGSHKRHLIEIDNNQMCRLNNNKIS